MDFFKVEGNIPLNGTLKINGAKNAALPIMAASILFKEPITLHNIPDLRDTRTMIRLLEMLGVKAKMTGHTLILDPSCISNHTAPYELIKTMRASIYVMGPLLATRGIAEVSFPGGCLLGVRPIDIHLNGFEKMGSSIKITEGNIIAECPKLNGTELILDFPSVGATCNLIMAAVLAKGETIIKNYAGEPEVLDLINFLQKSGANIKILPKMVVIRGVKKLEPIEYTIIPDRIELGTIGAAALATMGSVDLIWNAPDYISSFREKLEEIGCNVYLRNNIYHFSVDELVGNVDIKTMVYPGFPTDLQPIIGALLTITKGNSIIMETIFENRFMWVSEIERMGAKIKKDDRAIFIDGVDKLTAADIMASDIRAGAALLIAALAAEGETTLRRIYHIERGYEAIDKRLRKLGAKIVKGRE
jgi:UDP-N-acetylglucosamine 1-carboxyvinyltransferase